MSLESTKEQRLAMFAAMSAAGMDCWRGKAIEVLWPLVRDMVLEEAAKAFLASPQAGFGNNMAAEFVRAMKGAP